MVKTRTIVKNCPKCQSRVAVATKSCKCGYQFFNAKPQRPTTRSQTPEIDERRRTSRVRREKPNFYNSQEFEKKKKKKEKRVAAQPRRKLSPENPNDGKESTAARANRRRQRKEEDVNSSDLCSKLSLERQQLATLILSEINRKIGSVVWQPS